MRRCCVSLLSPIEFFLLLVMATILSYTWARFNNNSHHFGANYITFKIKGQDSTSQATVFFHRLYIRHNYRDYSLLSFYPTVVPFFRFRVLPRHFLERKKENGFFSGPVVRIFRRPFLDFSKRNNTAAIQ